MRPGSNDQYLLLHLFIDQPNGKGCGVRFVPEEETIPDCVTFGQCGTSFFFRIRSGGQSWNG